MKGPMDPKHWTRPRNYDRFLSKDEPPQGDTERRAYAREVLRRFATRAFRRPVDDRRSTVWWRSPNGSTSSRASRFEQGVARAMVAVLASPRFVFRVEATESTRHSRPSPPLVDEYALASRLSYFLWSTMPDDELFELAGTELRKNLRSRSNECERTRAAEAFMRNFVGQWLQVRDVDGITINTRAVLRQEGSRREDRPGWQVCGGP